MGQSTCSDVGINPLLGAGLGVVLAPIAGICREHIGQSAGCCSDALQHRLQMLNVRRLVAYADRHDQLMIAVRRELAVVYLQIGANRLH